MGPGKLMSGLTSRFPGLFGNTVYLDPRTSNLRLSERPGDRLVVRDQSGRIFRDTYALDSERKEPNKEIMLISPNDLPVNDISIMANVAGSTEGIKRYCKNLAFCPRIYRVMPGGTTEEDRSLVAGSDNAIPQPLRKWMGRGTVLFNCHAEGEKIDPFTVFLGLVHETSHLEFFEKWENLLERKGAAYTLLRIPVREFYAYVCEWNAGVKLINEWPFGSENAFIAGKKTIEKLLQQCSRNINTTYEDIKALHFDGNLKTSALPENMDSEFFTVEVSFKP